MASSLMIISAFVLGTFAALFGLLPEWIYSSGLDMWLLYALMLQVGISIGADPKLKETLRSLSPSVLLVPLATIVGTMVMCFGVSFLISRWSVCEK